MEYFQRGDKKIEHKEENNEKNIKSKCFIISNHLSNHLLFSFFQHRKHSSFFFLSIFYFHFTVIKLVTFISKFDLEIFSPRLIHPTRRRVLTICRDVGVVFQPLRYLACRNYVRRPHTHSINIHRTKISKGYPFLAIISSKKKNSTIFPRNIQIPSISKRCKLQAVRVERR